MERTMARHCLKKIFDELVEKFEFRTFLEKRESLDYLCWEEENTANNWLIVDGLSVHFCKGMTKAVLVVEEIGYVLKIPFRGRRADYCKRECENYRCAAKYGVADKLAWCDKLMDYGDVPIYIMEYAVTDSYEYCEYVRSNYPELAEEYEEDIDEETCVLEVCASEWGKDIFDAFCEFVNERNINDIHAGNVGWIGERLVIIDYSGYEG